MRLIENTFGGFVSDLDGDSPILAVREIVIFVETGFSLDVVMELVEVFDLANSIIADSPSCDKMRFDVLLLSSRGGKVVSNCSQFLMTKSVQSQGWLKNVDAVFVGDQLISENRDLAIWVSDLYGQNRCGMQYYDGWLLFGSIEKMFHASQISKATPEPTPIHVALGIICANAGIQLTRSLAKQIELPINGAGNLLEEGKGLASMSKAISLATTYIKGNIDRPISVVDVADAVKMSTRNFVRRFKSEIGVSPSEYIAQARLEKIYSLLLDTDLPIEKISRHCGLMGGNSLTKFFRKHVGITPTEYRLTRKRDTDE
jgi:AraC-like DNA-binding protein